MFSLKETSCGVIPVLYESDAPLYLIVRQTNGHWSFPKGHVERGETLFETAQREFQEETGITNATIRDNPVFTIHYTHRKGWIPRAKTVTFFIGFVYDRFIDIQEAEIVDYAWASFEEAQNLLHYKSSQDVLLEAHEYLLSTNAK